MLYLLYQFRTEFGPFRLFEYITFRAAGAALTAFIIGIVLGPWIIRRLKRMGVMEKPRVQGLELEDSAISAERVPTMGGVLIVLSIVLATALWAKPNELTFLGIATVSWLGMVGLIDDYTKLRGGPGAKRGISSLEKILLQAVLGVAVGFLLYYVMKDMTWGMRVAVPFVPLDKIHLVLPMLAFIAIVVVVIVGSSNAVNLTDGMDGLAVGCTIMASLAFTVISYAAGNSGFATYLKIPYIPEANELTVFCSAITGAGLAFLWFNCTPAQVYMGDTGSLSLGGALGYVAVVTRSELLLFIIGGVFVFEAASVILQVLYFKHTRRKTGEGKRLFLRAPIHHHFELLGIARPKVVVRFIIIGAVLTAISIATLKLH